MKVVREDMFRKSNGDRKKVSYHSFHIDCATIVSKGLSPHLYIYFISNVMRTAPRETMNFMSFTIRCIFVYHPH